MARGEDREVVFIERDDGGSALRWLMVGAAVGASLALLFAPRSGRELRREIRRGVQRVRHIAEDTVDEIRDSFGKEGAALRAETTDAYDEGEQPLGEADEADEADEPARAARPERPSLRAAREELERRLAAARARRRESTPEDEEPVA